MTRATISPKFQVVIPKKIRESMRLVAGRKVNVLQYGHHIEIVPVEPIKKLRGFLKGIKTDVPREKDRV
ncbi:MAG: AbrB/MazE/SpoVT family DNA-binding domain-containing protein [Phycisphaerae bacterium]